MRNLTSIVAVNHEGVIGCGNALPWRLRADMRFFRETTLDNVVIMGRKTHDSLGGKCLPQRYNVVITHNFGLFPETELCKSATGIEEGLARAYKAPSAFSEVFVVGGASMYEQFAPFVDRYLITLVNKPVPRGDTFFSRELLGSLDQWDRDSRGTWRVDEFNEAPFEIIEFRSRNPEAVAERRQLAIEQILKRAEFVHSGVARRRSKAVSSPAGYEPLGALL